MPLCGGVDEWHRDQRCPTYQVTTIAERIAAREVEAAGDVPIKGTRGGRRGWSLRRSARCCDAGGCSGRSRPDCSVTTRIRLPRVLKRLSTEWNISSHREHPPTTRAGLRRNLHRDCTRWSGDIQRASLNRNARHLDPLAATLLDACRDLARGLGNASTVSFLEAQPHRVIQEEMRRARAFVQHSVPASTVITRARCRRHARTPRARPRGISTHL